VCHLRLAQQRQRLGQVEVAPHHLVEQAVEPLAHG
jgi:hypothetical protein